jgi:hypothetical protein
MIRMRGDGPHCGNRRRRAFRRLDGTMDIPEHGAAAPTRNGPRRPRPVRGPHGQATPGTAAGQHLRGQPFPRWALRVDGLARGPEIHRGPRRPLELAGARAARRQAAQIDLARRRTARSGAIHSARPDKITRTFPATRSRSSYLTGSTATIRKTIPKRNSTSSTASQNDGSPTISEWQRPQKNRRELVTLEGMNTT